MLCMINSDIQQMFAYLSSAGMEEDELYRQITIEGEPTKYYVSNYGKVVSLCSGRAKEKCQQTDTKGYPYVDLYHHGKRHRYRIHRLVGAYFLREQPEQGEVLHHCDTNRKNNVYYNLVYLPECFHALWHELQRKQQGEQYANNQDCP